MAGAPSKKRTVESLSRDVESLNRLRMSIVVYEGSNGHAVVNAIDNLVSELLALRSVRKSA